PGQAGAQITQKRFQRGDRVERDEAVIGPGSEWYLRQVVGCRGEVLRLPELRHERHVPGEIEAARVVAAADLLDLGAWLAYQDVAAMGTYIRQAAQRSLRVARQQQRLFVEPV